MQPSLGDFKEFKIFLPEEDDPIEVNASNFEEIWFSCSKRNFLCLKEEDYFLIIGNILKQAPNFIHSVDKGGDTALHHLFRGEPVSSKIIKLLIEKGGDLDLANKKGETPRLIATRRDLRACDGVKEEKFSFVRLVATDVGLADDDIELYMQGSIFYNKDPKDYDFQILVTSLTKEAIETFVATRTDISKCKYINDQYQIIAASLEFSFLDLKSIDIVIHSKEYRGSYISYYDAIRLNIKTGELEFKPEYVKSFRELKKREPENPNLFPFHDEDHRNIFNINAKNFHFLAFLRFYKAGSLINRKDKDNFDNVIKESIESYLISYNFVRRQLPSVDPYSAERKAVFLLEAKSFFGDIISDDTVKIFESLVEEVFLRKAVAVGDVLPAVIIEQESAVTSGDDQNIVAVKIEKAKDCLRKEQETNKARKKRGGEDKEVVVKKRPDEQSAEERKVLRAIMVQKTLDAKEEEKKKRRDEKLKAEERARLKAEERDRLKAEERDRLKAEEARLEEKRKDKELMAVSKSEESTKLGEKSVEAKVKEKTIASRQKLSNAITIVINDPGVTEEEFISKVSKFLEEKDDINSIHVEEVGKDSATFIEYVANKLYFKALNIFFDRSKKLNDTKLRAGVMLQSLSVCCKALDASGDQINAKRKDLAVIIKNFYGEIKKFDTDMRKFSAEVKTATDTAKKLYRLLSEKYKDKWLSGAKTIDLAPKVKGGDEFLVLVNNMIDELLIDLISNKEQGEDPRVIELKILRQIAEIKTGIEDLILMEKDVLTFAVEFGMIKVIKVLLFYLRNVNAEKKSNLLKNALEAYHDNFCKVDATPRVVITDKKSVEIYGLISNAARELADNSEINDLISKISSYKAPQIIRSSFRIVEVDGHLTKSLNDEELTEIFWCYCKKKESVFYIPASFASSEEVLSEALQAFKSSGKRHLAIAIQDSNHFTAFHIVNDGSGVYKINYFDPSAKPELHKIPSHIEKELILKFGSENIIKKTLSAVQPSVIHNFNGESVAELSNLHCGAFVGYFLAEFVNEKFVVGDDCRIRIDLEGQFNVIPDLNKDDSDSLGRIIRQKRNTDIINKRIFQTAPHVSAEIIPIVTDDTIIADFIKDITDAASQKERCLKILEDNKDNSNLIRKLALRRIEDFFVKTIDIPLFLYCCIYFPELANKILEVEFEFNFEERINNSLPMYLVIRATEDHGDFNPVKKLLGRMDRGQKIGCLAVIGNIIKELEIMQINCPDFFEAHEKLKILDQFKELSQELAKEIGIKQKMPATLEEEIKKTLSRFDINGFANLLARHQFSLNYEVDGKDTIFDFLQKTKDPDSEELKKEKKEFIFLLSKSDAPQKEPGKRIKKDVFKKEFKDFNAKYNCAVVLRRIKEIIENESILRAREQGTLLILIMSLSKEVLEKDNLLCTAAFCGNIGLAKFLIEEKRCDINRIATSIREESSMSPLEAAISGDNNCMMKFLLSKGAKITEKFTELREKKGILSPQLAGSDVSVSAVAGAGSGAVISGSCAAFLLTDKNVNSESRR